MMVKGMQNMMFVVLFALITRASTLNMELTPDGTNNRRSLIGGGKVFSSQECNVPVSPHHPLGLADCDEVIDGQANSDMTETRKRLPFVEPSQPAATKSTQPHSDIRKELRNVIFCLAISCFGAVILTCCLILYDIVCNAPRDATVYASNEDIIKDFEHGEMRDLDIDDDDDDF